MDNVINSGPYLRTSRQFPPEINQLALEVNKSYVDIASNINNRTISIFATLRPAQTGESWFLVKNQKQQGFRQVYTFTSTADINIGFKLSSIDRITHAHGVYFIDVPVSYFGLIYGTSVAIAGQISFYVTVNPASTTSDIIRFVTGVGAPALIRGLIVLEWISES